MALRWNYTLGTGEFLISKSWRLDGAQIAIVFAITVISDDRFDIKKSELATLIIKNVSAMEDSTIQCAVQTSEGNWKYNIRLEITGERWITLIVFDRICEAYFKMRVEGGANLSTFLKLTRNYLKKKNKTKQTRFLSQTLQIHYRIIKVKTPKS